MMTILSKYHPAISEWMGMVDSGTVESSQEMKDLMPFLRKKLDKENAFIDNKRLDAALKNAERFFEYKLYPFQKFLLAFCTYVFVINEQDEKELMFNEFFIYAGRGFGKNTILSLASFELTTENHRVKNYNIDIVATSEDQAKTSFNDIHAMLDANKAFMKSRYSWSKTEIRNKKNGSRIRYRTSNPKTKDGGRPGAVGFDEIHAFEKYEAFNVHTTGLGKVPFPRRFYLTTDGYERGSVLDDIKDRARMVLRGELENSKLFPFICKLDNDDEVKDPTKWEKANPMLRYNSDLLSQVEQEYETALITPSLMIEFMTKRMNCPTEDLATAVATWENILATNQDIPDLERMNCIGAVDYARVRDFCGVGLLFKVGEKRYWIHHTFIPESALIVQKFNFDIEAALKQGLCTIVKGETIEPETVVEWFEMQAKNYRIQRVCMDDYKYQYMKPALLAAGFEPWIVRNGKVTHTKVLPLVDSLFAKNNIVYGNDMMMRWYTWNTYLDRDSKGNVSFEKIDPEKRKNDGFMALIHALTQDGELKTVRKLRRKPRSYSY
ncbi:terminase TerL endonuclease subunit [Listeria booriae]|uniref:terminase TerL endonuclease subunit n=1 Tax=Listeria booriae TaxID=1552123 RepID=UPI0021C9AF02|nr:terminase TerL endonuclease subunit [Listeria booriae]